MKTDLFETNVFDIPLNDAAAKLKEKMNEGITVFDDVDIVPMPLPGAPASLRGYAPWGDSNLRPNEILALLRNDEVLSSNIAFEIKNSYGLGLEISNTDDTPVTDPKILDWFKMNRYPKYLMEQHTDMKHFAFTVSVIILDAEGKSIVQLRHKEALYCRFETCNPKTGKVEHVFFGNWERGIGKLDEVEVIELLDISNPYADLLVRMGKLPNEEGKTGIMTKTRKFALMNEIPIPGNKYYPFPYYWAFFNSGWYDIKALIPQGKKAKFQNGLVIPYQVEINNAYWDLLFQGEQISDPAKQQERKKIEKENIKNFLTGINNAGKVLFSGFYVDPLGKEQSMVRITVVNAKKEGGDWLEDVEEASNMASYATGTAPSLIGVTPGKSQGSFSGSDKRELFTMKQAMEKPIRDIILEPYNVIAWYNGWDIKFEIPFIQLTTLDQKVDAVKTVTTKEQTQ